MSLISLIRKHAIYPLHQPVQGSASNREGKDLALLMHENKLFKHTVVCINYAGIRHYLTISSGSSRPTYREQFLRNLEDQEK